MKLIIIIKNQDELTIELRLGGKVLDQEALTINHYLDKLLIMSLDNILFRNRIDRLSLKALKIKDKLRDDTVASMIIRSVKAGLSV